MAAVMFYVSKTWLILLLMRNDFLNGKLMLLMKQNVVLDAAKIIRAEIREKKKDTIIPN